MAVDLILIVKSNIIIIMMNTDKKIISFYLEFSKTRKIEKKNRLAIWTEPH